MTSAKIVKWVDNKGFGFLRMEGNFNDVFVHISAFGRIPRTPRVGDMVQVKNVLEENGKTKVTEATIVGLKSLPYRKSPSQFARSQRLKISIAAAVVLGLGIAFVLVTKL